MSSPHRPLDPRSGLVLDTHELGRRAGAMKVVQTSVEAPADLGIERDRRATRIAGRARSSARVGGRGSAGHRNRRGRRSTGSASDALGEISDEVEVDCRSCSSTRAVERPRTRPAGWRAI